MSAFWHYLNSQELDCCELRNKKASISGGFNLFGFGAGEEIRTLDLHDGNVTLYQLSYTRVGVRI